MRVGTRGGVRRIVSTVGLLVVSTVVDGAGATGKTLGKGPSKGGP